ncbi:hypothetical protein L226DRAFT_510293 [Lentinus tigrinus ALCF2SS1-7]|uniref:F-box domain-containing protein n=1 Tax=Lentinus tigrinus ALCF2SS1-6 TaxID=1328759 RepID=A0A5C2S7V7_9APHY|nr:hypothetical protein L227DRAFT_527723 [Lentinus tigrinus ALCF2SS1-6]RPD73492.1 hypothetical protein L226DRAFT_510293 [Lentinus tigrinus ALCF2SS1-7]
MDKLKPKVGERHLFRYRRAKTPKQVENTKGKPPKGRNVGKLMQVLNVPVDVFLEIASHLHPLDVLHLSRTSIELREMLMSRNMRSIWIAARKKIDPPMPDCPDGLSEPQYASLVFETHCMACGAGRASWKYSYAARVRFCGACWKANVILGSKLVKQIGIKKDASIMSVIFTMLPTAAEYAWPFSQDQQNARNRFYEPEFLAVVDEYRKVQSEGPQALQEFVKKCTTETKARLKFDSDMRDWETRRSKAKNKLDDQIATDRATAIKQKLEELGYTTDDLPRWSSELSNILHQPRPLTTRIWNTVQPKLIKIVEAERARRAEEAFNQKWKSRLTALRGHYRIYTETDRALHPEKRILPNFEVARKLPCMEALLTSVEDPQEELTEKQFASVEATFLQEVEAQYWRPSRHFLAQLVRSAKSGAAEASGKGKKTPKATAAVTNRKPKGKGKGKKRAVDEDSDSEIDSDGDEDYDGPADGQAQQDVDEAADSALLTSLTSLFECPTCNMYSMGIITRHMTCKELLEHWQDRHSCPPWETNCIRVFPSPTIPRLLRALRLPPNVTLSDIEEVLWASSATPTCSLCRSRRPYHSPLCRTLSSLIYHIDCMHCKPMKGQELVIDLGGGSSVAAASTSRE